MEELFEKFTQNLDILKSYKQAIHTMFLYKTIHDHETLALGYLCLNELEKLFESTSNIFLEKDKLNFDLINNLCDSFIKAINGFNIMAQKFEKIYKEENEKNKILKEKSKEQKHKKNNSNETDSLKDNIIDINDKIKED